MARKKSVVILMGLIAVCVTVIIISLVFCNAFGTYLVDDVDPSMKLPPSPYEMGKYKYGALVSNGGPCAAIGKRILAIYGSAVDALIATMVCESIACVQNMGPGGGFILTGYHKASGVVYTLNARETAPAAATVDMFHGNPNSSQYGGLAVGVPGEIRGYHELYKKYGGKAPWYTLFEDTIKLCRIGIPINKHLAASILNYRHLIMASPSVRAMLIKENGQFPVEGDLLKLPKLASTLEIIAMEGPDALYNGRLTKDFVRDIQEEGGIITEEDMKNYSVRWENPIISPLKSNLTVYSVPPPGSGLIFSFILRLLDGYLNTGDAITDYQRITEAFKFGYGRRTELGDPHYLNISKVMTDLVDHDYIMKIREKISDTKTSQNVSFYGGNFYMKEDHGTANVVVMAPNGDVVVATSTINLVFGSMLVSKSTGIVLNNEMDDFSAPSITNYFGLPPSPANFIAPGKRPMSSMCPSIILNNKGDVRLAVGSAGGTRITTSSALVTIWNLWYNKTIKEAVDEPRFHHQLWPMVWSYEYGVLKAVVDGLTRIGHQVSKLGRTWRTSVTAISNKNGVLSTVCDFRRPGSIDGY